MSGCTIKGHRTAQTIKCKAEIQLYMPECKPKLKSVRACNADQHGYFGGLLPNTFNSLKSIIFTEDRHTRFPVYAINLSENYTEIVNTSSPDFAGFTKL